MNECTEPASHEAHMAINGECPFCGFFDPEQTEFMDPEDATAIWG